MMTKDELLKRAKKHFKLATEADAKQRDREREDLRFQVGEYQWDEDAKAQRRGGTLGAQTIPARPMLSISLLHQPRQLVYNQAASAQLGVEIHPVSEDANKELAEVKQGLYRRIERDSNADQARLWAFDRAIQCGRGWYRVITKYDEESEETLDQEIAIERILHQDMVYPDPAATKPDYSDARFIFVAAYMPLDTFEAEFPDAKGTLTGFNFMASDKDEPDWVRGDGEERAVLVAEYWYKEFKRGTRGPESVTVKVCKLTGVEILEEQEWGGHYIPLIPVIGRELQPFDGERRWEGLVRPARDGQKFYNYAASNLVERMALEPKAPWVGTVGQFEGFEDIWQQANLRNFPFLPYKAQTEGDHLVPPPSRTPIDGTGMSLSLLALQEAKQFVQAATAVFEPSLGEAPKRKDASSGRAILALQSQSDAGTSHFIQNLAKITMKYEARVILDLMPQVYDRPGRVTQVLGGEDETRPVMLGKPFIVKDGRPVPASPGLAGVKNYDLSKGRYAISVSIGKAYQTRLQEGQAEIGEILSAAPNLMPILGATYFRFRDFPGAKEIADILKKLRDRQYPGLSEGEEPVSIDQLQAENFAIKQQLQQLQQALQQAMQGLATDKAKQEAMIAKAQIDAQSKQVIATLEQQTKLILARLEQATKMMEGERQRGHEREVQEFDAVKDIAVAAAQPPDLAYQSSLETPLGGDESV